MMYNYNRFYVQICIILLSVTRNECVANECVCIVLSGRCCSILILYDDDDDDYDMTQKDLEIIVNYYYHQQIHDA